MTPTLPDIIQALTEPSNRLDSDRFRRAKPRLGSCGLYAWWADDDARSLLGTPFGLVLPELIYAGQTGATRWPSGTPSSATLASRIGSQHFTGHTNASTFRRTLASILRGPLALALDPAKPGRLEPVSNGTLSTWIAAHLQVAVCPVDDPDHLIQIEEKMLEILDPPLNLDSSPSNALRARLTVLRQWLR